jgi:SAM-dependent methyltransferase
MAGEFADHFSGRAPEYAAFRPRYPAELFQWLASICPRHELAWDAGTGSGQAAVMLARHFREVIATDASASQLAHAEPHPRVLYREAVAGRGHLPSGAVDLVTVAQALHWFDLPVFWREVRECLTEYGVVAAWCYGLLRITPEVDRVVEHYSQAMLGPWWPPERRLVDEGYRTVDFPFREIAAPEFAIAQEWSLSDLLGYLGTWSAGQRYRAGTGEDPLALIQPALDAAWGDPARRRPAKWPLSVRAGRRPTRWRRREY